MRCFMGGSSGDDEESKKLEEEDEELRAEKAQQVQKAELQRVSLLKRAQGGGGMGNIFSGINEKLG